MASGELTINVEDGIARLCFSHPKANSLPAILLNKIAEAIESLSANSEVRVILIESAGDGAFCAGASFEEFQKISNVAEGEQFFLGFAKVLMAIRSSSCFVVSRVQGKVVGGGVGIVAACDYSIATSESAVKLSEFALGIGPFTIGPAVERKIGVAAFSQMSIDVAWRSALWAQEHGLYSALCDDTKQLDSAVDELLTKLAEASAAATSAMRSMFWEGTENWNTLLPERARISGELLAGRK
jgi:methylglutaconyl-CoA hydratase